MEQTEFEHIAKTIRRKAVSTALACSIGADGAEDIAQDVMLKLWTMRENINNQTEAEKLAVCIARNKAVDCHRKNKTVIQLDQKCSIYDDRQPTPDICMETTENQEWLVRRISALPSTEYQILHMRQVERKTNDEIARLLGIEKTSVATLLSRARMKILKEIKKRME